jgi:hypothetical protein
MIEAKDFRTFITIYFLFKSERLSVKNKIDPTKHSIMTYAWPAGEFAADKDLLKLQCLQKSSPHHLIFSKAHAGSRFAHGFQTSVRIRLYNKIMQATSRSHTKS